MKNEKYLVGLDIGTDSVGYAVTNEQYELCKHRGEPMWGVTLFDEAQLAAERRTYRTARRRLDRRQQRVRLIQELFAAEIAKVDENFFKRIQESYLYPETKDQKVRLFGTYEQQKAYVNKYPTIHHLICELMESKAAHDPRLVYNACAWLVAHRGHFLSEVDKHHIDQVTDFQKVFRDLTDHIQRDGLPLPWNKDIDIANIEKAMRAKLGITSKSKLLASTFFPAGKATKEITESCEYNYDLVIKALCGGTVKLCDLFGKEDYRDLEEKSVALSMDDEKLIVIQQTVAEEEAEFLAILKAVYDWSVLVDVLNGKNTISEAKVEVFSQHKADLHFLKYFVKKYLPPKAYFDLFRSATIQNNYAAYIGKNVTANEECNIKKLKNTEDFCKYVLSLVKSVSPDHEDEEQYQDMMRRLETADFLPKQVDGDNRVIPYQLYWYELNRILENAQHYIPFLRETDEDGITGAEKILSIFEFKIPYYVGPLRENPDNDKKKNYWMVRKAQGKIYPWNFDCMIDQDASEEAFIARMTNSCTYLPGEDVLPKNSLIYSAFEVLNEINNIKINGAEIPIPVKQSIYENLFMQKDKVTPSQIRNHMLANDWIDHDTVISGLDTTIKSSLKPFRAFGRLVSSGLLTYSDAENIIRRATYSEDKVRYRNWLRVNFPSLPESEISYISKLKFKEFGRLSRKLLCGIEGAINEHTGEYMTIIRTMWETNYNFMQLMTDQFDFKKHIEECVKEHYGCEQTSIAEKLDELRVSNAVKRPIIRTLDILKDVVKVHGHDPDKIFVEMARGASEEQKGKRTTSRLKQIQDLYKTIKHEDIPALQAELDAMGEDAHNKLQSDKIFLYFIQLGKCLYTEKPIPISSVLAGDGKYNIEHIYPRSFVKDDSILNNKILVNSEANGDKSDSYPIDPAIQSKMRGTWEYMHRIGLITDEKFKRLIRTTGFTEDEKYEFINRQLVETRQSTKAVTALLKEIYPQTEIVYVKAGLVSDFRQEFNLLKSRAVNDLHHAKDAYLNIVVGNVWHHKFSRPFWRSEDDHNVKAEVVFTHPVTHQGKTIWNGAADKDRVIKIASKNTAHMTMYSYYKHSGQNGGFFDQNPLPAKEGLIPLKKNLPTEIYGGYDSATVSGFVLAKHRSGKKTEITVVPIPLLHMKKFLEDDQFASEYVAEALGEKATDIEILLNKRILKIYTMISLDGARFCIRGKAGSTEIGLMNMMPFMTSRENEYYIKKLESFEKKRKTNEKIIWNEKYDGISNEKNKALYDLYIQKLSAWPYQNRPRIDTFVNKLIRRSDEFDRLDVYKQTEVLLQIQGILGRVKQADLKHLKESSSSGIAAIALNLSNLKKNYTDVRIIDQSASGLFESVSENLLDLL